MKHFYVSPLRYPGGKAALADFLAHLMGAQHPRPRVYIEPFAGGAGAALRLLYEEQVDRIVLNDLSSGIAAFWRAVFKHTEELVERVHTCELTIDAWHQYRAQYQSADGSDVERGFATLYLNRTNRSGILNARPIGGLRQQGRWKLDVRFNRKGLADRITLLGAYRDRVEVYERDALDLLADIDTADALLYIDPPYLLQGDELYLNTLEWGDHKRLAELLTGQHRRWMLTYNADRRVPDVLYRGLRCAEFSIKHTAAVQQMGTEYAVFSPSLQLPDVSGLSKRTVRWLPATDALVSG